MTRQPLEQEMPFAVALDLHSFRLTDEQFFQLCQDNEDLRLLNEVERESFVPLCPDFVLESRSATDRLSFLRDKMQEYVANGAQLGLLIDPKSRQVYVYRNNQPVESLDNPRTISGDPVLAGFVLDLKDIW